MILDVLAISVQAILLYLLVDLIAGFFHWAEDTLGTPTTPIWGALFVKPNVIHHEQPNEMNKIHWFRNSLPIYGICVAVILIAWLRGTLNWQIWFVAFVGLFAQQTHRWSHSPRAALPKIVVYLQRVKVLQDSKHHWKHHRGDHNTHFCVGTPWLNPILDKLAFWRLMERILVPIFGAPRRPDLTSKPWYADKALWD